MTGLDLQNQRPSPVSVTRSTGGQLSALIVLDAAQERKVSTIFNPMPPQQPLDGGHG
jgi:hypothetical protein